MNPPLTEGETTEPGPDLAIAAATGQLAGNATVNVFFRPGPTSAGPGAGPDEIAAAVFSIDYDETRLGFNSSDANGDGTPDAIIPSVPAAFEMTVLFDPGDTNGELDFVIVDLDGAQATLPEGNLFSITFVSQADTQGTASVSFAGAPEVSIADQQGVGHLPDEVLWVRFPYSLSRVWQVSAIAVRGENRPQRDPRDVHHGLPGAGYEAPWCCA